MSRPQPASRTSRLLEYGADQPIGDLPTSYHVQLDVETGIVMDISPLDGATGSSLSNEIHAVDVALQPPS